MILASARRGLVEAVRRPLPHSERTSEKHQMQKLSTVPFRAAKKTERKVSKGKGKETYPGYFGNPLRSARACLRVKRPKPTCSYEFAGAAADEVAKTVWGTRRDRNTWAGFCRYGNCDDIIERAHLYASMFEQGEIKNPITSLQNWLNETYPETAAYLAYRARRKGGVK